MLNFINNAIRTESKRQPVDTSPTAPATEQDIVLSRLLHASIGMNTEQAEFADMLKKHLFYGKPLDQTNLKEELGDMLWYIAVAMDALGTDFDTEMNRVINKLRVRFPDKFTDHHAENRDLVAERKVLEAS